MEGETRAHSERDMRLLRALLGRYGARYYLSGPEKDALIARTFKALTSNPDVFFEGRRKGGRGDDAPEVRATRFQ